MKKILSLLVLLSLIKGFCLAQTYQPLEDQRLSTTNDPTFGIITSSHYAFPQIIFKNTTSGINRPLYNDGASLKYRFDGTNDVILLHSGNLNGYLAGETLQNVTDRGSGTSLGKEIQFYTTIPGRFTYVGGNREYGRIGTYDMNSGSKNLIINEDGGNVGIGTTSPTYKLHVNGAIHSPNMGDLVPSLYLGSNTINDNIYQIQFGQNDDNQLGMGYYTSAKSVWSRWGLGIHVKEDAEFSVKSSGWNNLFGVQGGTGNTFVLGNLAVGATSVSNDQGWNRVMDLKGNGSAKILATTGYVKAGIYSHDNWGPGASARIGTETNHPLILMAGYGQDAMIVNTNGRVGIGTMDPQSELAVKGTITSKKVKVMQDGWADYVFDSSYQLPSLAQVESFIKEKKHLPEIPSAAEIKKEGLDIGDNQAMLLKKIEELTLYVIQQNKEISQMRQEITELKRR